METAAPRVYRLLLLDRQRSWMQRELAARAACSPSQVSRIVGDLVGEGVLARPYKNRIVLLGAAKLLTLWSSRHRLPLPVYVRSRESPVALAGRLGRQGTAALTLFAGAWHRTRYFRAATLEAWVQEGRLDRVIARLGRRAREPTAVALYPTEGRALEGAEAVAGVPVVSVPQNFVDLMAFGGQGARVALHLALAAGYLEV